MTDYNLCKKQGAKWWTFGKFAKNKWGNFGASFKVTQEFKDLVSNCEIGTYLNLSAFEDDRDKRYKHDAQPKKQEYIDPGLDSDIPF